MKSLSLAKMRLEIPIRATIQLEDLMAETAQLEERILASLFIKNWKFKLTPSLFPRN